MAFQVTFGKGGMATSQLGGLTPALLDEAQKSGKMNLVARGIEKICDDILGINERASQKEELDFSKTDSGVKWYERVTVTSLLLNSNSIKEVCWFHTSPPIQPCL